MTERESPLGDLSPFIADDDFVLYVGDVRDVLRSLPDESIECCVTSPPYWGLRDYGEDEQIGLEATPEVYVGQLVAVFQQVRRILKPEGTLWLNLGDSYSHGGNGSRDPEKWPKQSRNDHRIEHRNTAGGKPKDLIGIPWRVAFALQADGWYLRSDIIWHKPNPMPESVTDRPTKSHEYVFLLTKSGRYFYNADAIREGYKYDGRKVLDREAGAGSHENHRTNGGKRNRWPGLGKASHEARGALAAHGHDESEPMEIVHAGRNARSVWEIATQPYPEAHFATFPEELPRRCILAGCPEGGTVLDPFMGSGTTAKVARDHGRKAIGVELNPDYAALCDRRNAQKTIFAKDAA